MTAITAIPPKSFGIGILEGIMAKMASQKSREASFLLGFLQVESLNPAKYWDLIGILSSDLQ
jgi:hypothetical protein